MSHDPRYCSPLHRAPAPSPLDSTRPAVFHRARIVEIKRRRPSSTGMPITQAEQQPFVETPRYESSPPPRGDSLGRTSMSVSPSRAGDYVPSGGDFPPPPPPHSPSQRSVNIAQGSYINYNSSAPPSRSAYFSKSHHHPRTQSRHHLQEEEFDSNVSPSVAQAAPDFSYNGVTHQQTAPPPLPPRRRDVYDPRRLLPAAIRPSQAFQFELEEDILPQSSSDPDIPGRFPSSPDTVRSNVSSIDTQMGGLQEQTPKLRPEAGSYHELQPNELGMVYSNPALYQLPAIPSDQARQSSGDRAQPFLYEVRSPRKADHTGSNKATATATANRAAYSARNPADEADSYRIMRRLGADEIYATSFCMQRGAGTPEQVVADETGGEGIAMDDRRTLGGANLRETEAKTVRSERRLKR